MKRRVADDPIAALHRLITDCGSQQKAADRLAISKQYVWLLVNGRRRFTDSMLAKLGLRRTVVALEK